jgi:acyl carrier protein
MSTAAMERLYGVMSDVLRTPRAGLTAASKAEDIPDWDSLRTIYLATALESEFSVTLTPEEIAGLISVPDIVGVLAAKGIT